MPTITLRIKTNFGDIEISGRDKNEVLESMKSIDQTFIEEFNEYLSDLTLLRAQDHLKGIIQITKDGPILVTMKDITHYEAIGIIFYAMKNYQASSREIKERLMVSGKNVTVPARIHEMKKRGYIFKPGKGSIYKLSMEGIKWIEGEVIPKLKN